MTKFTTTAATVIGTTKAPVETVAGVKGYATPLTWGLSETQGADIASVNGTTDIGAATGPYIHVTGTNTITGLGTCTAGQQRTVKFTGAAGLTHNGTSLILPGAQDIVCAANDTASFRSLGSGNWICEWYKRQTKGVRGTNTNDSAAAGYEGEYVETITTQGSAVALTSATNHDIASVSLTAGDWDVQGLAVYTLNAATVMTTASQWLSTTSATLPTPPAGGYTNLTLTFATGASQSMPTFTVRFSLSATTTVYMTVRSNFTTNTNAAYGIIRARRVR